MHRRIDTAGMPEGRTVIEIFFSDAPRGHRSFWLVRQHPEVDVCLKPTGFDVDVKVTTSVRCLAEIWRGIRPLRTEIAAGRMKIDAPLGLARSFPDWLMLSVFAETKRCAPRRS